MIGKNRHNWPDFFCKGTFFESWVNNLTVFKKSGLGLEKVVLDLEKIGGLGLETKWSCYITGL